jgi:uncharacterized protein (DUF305 family)
MPKNLKQATKLSIVIGVGAIALAGCTINLGTNDADENGMMNGNGMMGNHSSANPTNRSGFSGADIMFAQMMIPHHQQAVLMSNLALKTSSNPDIIALAKEIKAAQQPEINQMKVWLTKAGAPLEMGHSMGMGGMLTDSEIATLSAAKGADFDKLFLQGMIAHHQGAIHMAQMVLDSSNAEAAKLGNDIVESQTKQITYMQGLLAK